MSIKSKTDKILNNDTARFFMPGHKGNLSFYDITEIPGADNLNCPYEEIASAQKKIAKTYGSDNVYISVNGSSAGILASILALCKDEKILADRSCHISAINGMILANSYPVWLYPEYDNFFGISKGITKEMVEKALKETPDIKAVIITSPTYYGVVSDIKGICEVAHKQNIPVIVDGAHGAHFAFSDKLPQCAIKCGADVVIHSTHKTLNCLTQGAIIHCSGNLVNHKKIKQALNMVQTTSPSYLLMSSVEQSVLDGQSADFDGLVEICEQIRNESSIKCVKNIGFDYDKTRLVFNGKNLDKIFEKENIIVEMYDGHNAVLMPSPYNKKEDFIRLLNLVKSTDTTSSPATVDIPEADVVTSPMEAFYGDEVYMEKEKAIGKIATKPVYKMPPCIPVICPGERITKDNIKLVTDEKIWCR